MEEDFEAAALVCKPHVLMQGIIIDNARDEPV